MKIAFWDSRSPHLGLQNKLKDEGHEVHVYVRGHNKRKTTTKQQQDAETLGVYRYSAIADVATSYKQAQYDLTFATDHIAGLAKIAYNAIGVSPINIELNRKGGIELIQKLAPSIRIPKSVYTFEDALSIKTPYVVVKMENNVFNNAFGKLKTFILSKSDLLNMRPLLEKTRALYQEYIVGKEVAFGGYFGGGHFVRPYTWIQEYKRVDPQSINNQIICGESGSCGTFTPNLPFGLADVLTAHEPALKGYTGFIDINTMITPKGDTYFLEYTSRMGFPTEYELLSVLDQSYSSFLLGLLAGKDYKVKSECFASVKVTDYFRGTVPYTITTPRPPKGVYVVPVNAIRKNRVWEAAFTEDQLVVTGTGANVEECSKALYQYLHTIKGVGIHYLEHDVGNNWIW